MKAKGIYSVKDWQEHDFQKISDDIKISWAQIEYAVGGGIEGSLFAALVMSYTLFDENDPHKSEAEYTGMLRFDGTIDNLKGSFLMQDIGTFTSGAAISKLAIIPGSGSGDFAAIEGDGTYKADGSGMIIELDFELSNT